MDRIRISSNCNLRVSRFTEVYCFMRRVLVSVQISGEIDRVECSMTVVFVPIVLLVSSSVLVNVLNREGIADVI